MGRLRISSIDVDLPLYHGTSDDVLEASATSRARRFPLAERRSTRC